MVSRKCLSRNTARTPHSTCTGGGGGGTMVMVGDKAESASPAALSARSSWFDSATLPLSSEQQKFKGRSQRVQSLWTYNDSYAENSQ